MKHNGEANKLLCSFVCCGWVEVFKPKAWLASTHNPTIVTLSEPKNHKVVLQDSNWRGAMNAEYEALLQMRHGLLFPYPMIES